MTIDKELAISDWASRLEATFKVLKAASKFQLQLPVDPFETRRRLQGIIDKLRAARLESLLPPEELMQQLDAECTRQKAEFWSELTAACVQRGWELHGTTSRRLVKRGLFVEATDDEVLIETLPAMQTFHVPKVMKELDGVMCTLAGNGLDQRQLMELVQRAFDALGGGGERPLEEIYRGVVWHAQKWTFWKTLGPKHFVRITRPQFRSFLTQALQLGMRSPDGRELRLGTTVQAKEAWEMYSPGEARVVQVGRLSLS
jgi:hypothetical protein